MTNIGIEMSLRHILSEKFLYDESTYLRLKDNLIAYTADYRLAYRYIQTSWWKAEKNHITVLYGEATAQAAQRLVSLKLQHVRKIAQRLA